MNGSKIFCKREESESGEFMISLKLENLKARILKKKLAVRNGVIPVYTRTFILVQ